MKLGLLIKLKATDRSVAVELAVELARILNRAGNLLKNLLPDMHLHVPLLLVSTCK